MKRFKKFPAALALALVIALAAPIVLPAGLGSSAAQAATVKINAKKKTLKVGTTYQLKVTGTKKDVTWKSSKPSVAKVSKKGLVTAKAVGKTNVTAKVGSKKLVCKITVKAYKNPALADAPFDAAQIDAAQIDAEGYSFVAPDGWVVSADPESVGLTYMAIPSELSFSNLKAIVMPLDSLKSLADIGDLGDLKDLESLKDLGSLGDLGDLGSLSQSGSDKSSDKKDSGSKSSDSKASDEIVIDAKAVEKQLKKQFTAENVVAILTQLGFQDAKAENLDLSKVKHSLGKAFRLSFDATGTRNEQKLTFTETAYLILASDAVLIVDGMEVKDEPTVGPTVLEAAEYAAQSFAKIK